jgi:hypothetical protein
MSAGLGRLIGRQLNITRQKESATLFKSNADGIANVPWLRYARRVLKPARTSPEKSFGCSQAAKWPPFSSLL